MLSSLRAYPEDMLWVLAYAVFYFAAKNDVVSGYILFVAGANLANSDWICSSPSLFRRVMFVLLSNNFLRLNMAKNFV